MRTVDVTFLLRFDFGKIRVKESEELSRLLPDTRAFRQAEIEEFYAQ
jgi:hypothetical protein